jgi:hypothetical protein
VRWQDWCQKRCRATTLQVVIQLKDEAMAGLIPLEVKPGVLAEENGTKHLIAQRRLATAELVFTAR